MVPETMKKILLTLAPLAVAFALSGCFQSETTITVNADGSGTITDETTFGAQMSAMLGGLGGLGGEDANKPAKDPLDEMFSADKAKEKASAMGEGVTLDKVEKINKDGKKGARITYKFADVNKIKVNPDEATSGMDKGLGDGLGGEAGAKVEEAKKKTKPFTFKLDGGTLTVNMPRPDAKEKPAKGEAEKPAPEGEKPDAAEQAQAEQMMKTMFADMKVGIKLVIAPGIAKTDATHVEGKEITLMEMNFGELMTNPDGLKIMEKMKDKKPEEIAEAVKGLKGVKVEPKEKITVKLK